MEDVTAVVLTIGEETTERALRSVSAQSLRPADVVIVADVKPFYRAFNAALAKVRTPFFLQVDADMVLDDACLASLRGAVRPEVGIAVGALRDPLVGPINGVKLFRRECFEAAGFRDTVACDFDFYTSIARQGWLTLNILAPPERSLKLGHTFGDHLPAYTPSYTYATYYLLGSRYASRRDPAGLRWRLRELRASAHPMATVARAALGHGAFSTVTRDVAKTDIAIEDDVLAGLVECRDSSCPEGLGLPLEDHPERFCDVFYELGRELRRKGSYAALGQWLRALAQADEERSWLGEVALHHGFLGRAPDRRVFETLRTLL